MSATLKSIDYSVLQQCMHCGMCLPTCPTYDTTKRERNSPRGRIALMRAIADDELAVSREFAEEMSYCLGCLACQTACPAGVNYAELFETARNDIETAGAHPGLERRFWRALTLRFLFMHPRALRGAGRLLRVYQRSGLEGLVRRSGALRLLPAALRRVEPQAPRVGAAFSNRLIARGGASGRCGSSPCRTAHGLCPGSRCSHRSIAIPPMCCSRTAARLIRRPFSPAAVRSTRTTAISTERGSWRAG